MYPDPKVYNFSYICSMNNPNTPQEFNPVNNAENFDVDTYIDMMVMYQDFLNEIQLEDLYI